MNKMHDEQKKATNILIYKKANDNARKLAAFAATNIYYLEHVTIINYFMHAESLVWLYIGRKNDNSQSKPNKCRLSARADNYKIWYFVYTKPRRESKRSIKSKIIIKFPSNQTKDRVRKLIFICRILARCSETSRKTGELWKVNKLQKNVSECVRSYCETIFALFARSVVFCVWKRQSILTSAEVYVCLHVGCCLLKII